MESDDFLCYFIRKEGNRGGEWERKDGSMSDRFHYNLALARLISITLKCINQRISRNCLRWDG